MISLRPGVPLIEVVRDGSVESRHSGHVVVCDADGAVTLELGDVRQQIFPRSCAKLFQAVGMQRLGLSLPTPWEAMSAASHSGEPVHVSQIELMLESGSLSENDLQCPPERPVNLSLLAEPRRLTMNCSGKHAAMLLTCLVQGWPISDYLSVGHPLQASLHGAIEEITREPAQAVAVDGCGAPVVSASLIGLARGYAALAGGSIAAAMREHPFLVGGTGRAATLLMQAAPGLLAKDGAEGVFACALPDGRAVAVKIDDGAGRAAEQTMAAVLRSFGVSVELPSAVFGGGEPVGEIRPVAQLRL